MSRFPTFQQLDAMDCGATCLRGCLGAEVTPLQLSPQGERAGQCKTAQAQAPSFREGKGERGE